MPFARQISLRFSLPHLKRDIDQVFWTYYGVYCVRSTESIGVSYVWTPILYETVAVHSKYYKIRSRYKSLQIYVNLFKLSPNISLKANLAKVNLGVTMKNIAPFEWGKSLRVLPLVTTTMIVARRSFYD